MALEMLSWLQLEKTLLNQANGPELYLSLESTGCVGQGGMRELAVFLRFLSKE